MKSYFQSHVVTNQKIIIKYLPKMLGWTSRSHNKSQKNDRENLIATWDLFKIGQAKSVQDHDYDNNDHNY